MTAFINSYKDLIVWQRAMQLTVSIYKLTSQFPFNEQNSLTSQMQRAAVSIASNIAEGRHRGSRKDFIRFLRIAYASATELETQILIAKQLEGTKRFDCTESENLLLETLKMLNTMLQKLTIPPPKAES